MTYEEELKDVRWLLKRIEIYTRDNFRCHLCGGTYDLQVHHIRYKKNCRPWEYDNSNLITLCGNCHDKSHHSEKLVLKGDFLLIPIRSYKCDDELCFDLYGCYGLCRTKEKFQLLRKEYLMITKRGEFEKRVGSYINPKNIARIEKLSSSDVRYVSLPKIFKDGDTSLEGDEDQVMCELAWVRRQRFEYEFYVDFYNLPPFVYDIGIVSIDNPSADGWHKGTLRDLCPNFNVL